MPLFETTRGRLELMLPGSTWEQLNNAVAVYQVLLKERKVTGRRLNALEHERSRAIEADRLALGRALKEGKPDPGNKDIERIEKEIEACRRRFEALDHSLDEAENDLVEIVDEHRETWKQETESAYVEACEGYAESIDALSRARAKMVKQASLLHWLTHFPDQPSFRIAIPGVRRLLAVHGDPYQWDQVTAALREEAEPMLPATQDESAPSRDPDPWGWRQAKQAMG